VDGFDVMAATSIGRLVPPEGAYVRLTTGKINSPFGLEAVGLVIGISKTAMLKDSMGKIALVCVAATSIPLRTPLEPLCVTKIGKGTVATARVS
jgi:hypothetical protein